MSDQRATGLIVRMYPFADTSWIVHWSTAEYGRLATLARGARRAKSPFHGRLDLFYSGPLSFVPARRSTLHTLREFAPDERYAGVRSDYQKLQQAAYAVALLERGTETDTPIPELHALMTGWLRHLDQHPAQPRNVYAFEARFLEQLGFDPGSAAKGLRPEARELLAALQGTEWESLPHLVASGGVVRQVGEFLRRQLSEALGAVPAGRADVLRLPARDGTRDAA